MVILSEAEKKRIAEAIREVEMKSSGEFVTVVARAADTYAYIPLLWASLTALTLPAIIWAFPLELELPLLYTLQLAAFVVFAMLFHWMPLKMRMIPRTVKRHRASRLAWEQFFAQNLHLTSERTGVLLFVSVAERYVEIVADKGINDKVKEGAWQEIVADFSDHVKKKRITDGLVSAIGACGDLLAESFPRRADDKDELPNRLIEI